MHKASRTPRFMNGFSRDDERRDHGPHESRPRACRGAERINTAPRSTGAACTNHGPGKEAAPIAAIASKRPFLFLHEALTAHRGVDVSAVRAACVE